MSSCPQGAATGMVKGWVSYLEPTAIGKLDDGGVCVCVCVCVCMEGRGVAECVSVTFSGFTSSLGY